MKGLFASKRLLRALMAVAACLLPAPLLATQATLTADAHVSNTQPAVNGGGLSNLNVGNGYTALVQFDLGVLPANTTSAKIAKATLRLYCNRVDATGTVSVEPVYGSWTESGVTYTTLPVMGTVLDSTQVPAANRFVTMDVTAQVQGWVDAPGSNYGLALVSSAAVVQFDSKENDQTSHAPQLEIVFAASSTSSSGAGGTGAIGSTGAIGVTGATGAAGLVGARGATGATGAIGLTGATGATGAPGAVGATGAAGAGLVNYRGSYQSTMNYANGDVVTFAGSTYISQGSSNVGNTPGFTTNWGLLASVGAAGAAGPAGVTGTTGQQGPPGFGVQGVTGATGVTGNTGATGRPGLVYQGTYGSTTNYALGDVVLWAGSSFASLMDANHGNTPGMVPGTWGLLTSQGPVGITGARGATGVTGATGVLGPVGPPGERGDQGAQGLAGQAGAQGLPGVTGSTGLQGPMGSTGPAGPVGMSFQGAYSAATNYSLGQAVLWKGAGWVSLLNGNHGNTPDASPSAWNMFAASGASGITGATGNTGLQGATGTAGAAGSNGLNGVTGATGVTGTPGLAYQGTYNSTTNYVLGDVVLWNGSSYASLLGSNRGNTPGAAPSTWGLLTAQGPAGAMGATGGVGATGATGSIGLTGPAGPQGVQGATGVMGNAGPQGFQGATGATGPAGPTGSAGGTGMAGAQGIAGTTGATGPQGVVGATGAVGPVGLSFQGTYRSTTNYSVGQGVSWQGAGYVSLQSGNVGNVPDQSPAMWAIFAAPGATGVTGATGLGVAGATGATGTTGNMGSTGATGTMGATGSAGLRFLGSYSSSTGYSLGDGVSYNGSSYVSLSNNNHGQAPDTNSGMWALLAAQGTTGVAGGAGQVGATGATGSTGAVGLAGATGATGQTGAQGTVGMTFRGAWNQTTRYAANDAVTFAGSTYLATVAGTGQEPDQNPQDWAVLAEAGGVGPAGVAGATGTAATISVGTVTTLAAGSQATVNNSGTASAAVLNFGIPQGATGSTSNPSPAASAPRVPAIYHAVNYNSLYYAVNSGAGSATETAAVLAWTAQACTASRLDVYSQQSSSIKVTLRVGTSATLSSTALSCTASPNASCSSTGAVSVTAGQFMDLYVQFSSANTAGVWMAVECDP